MFFFCSSQATQSPIIGALSDWQLGTAPDHGAQSPFRGSLREDRSPAAASGITRIGALGSDQRIFALGGRMTADEGTRRDHRSNRRRRPRERRRLPLVSYARNKQFVSPGRRSRSTTQARGCGETDRPWDGAPALCRDSPSSPAVGGRGRRGRLGRRPAVRITTDAGRQRRSRHRSRAQFRGEDCCASRRPARAGNTRRTTGSWPQSQRRSAPPGGGRACRS